MRSRIWLLALGVVLLGALPGAGQGQGRGEPNLVAIHDPASPDFGRDCLSCHQAVLQESSSDPRVAAIHIKMLPYTPGFNPRRGVTSAVCVQCHRSTDTREGSAAGLRVQVDRKLCALCHGPSGPGKPLYK
ncbi:MAG: hypothetical protein ACP5NF_07570 [Thermoanaerobaculum sp.]